MYQDKIKLSLLMCLLISSGVLPGYAQEVVAEASAVAGQSQAQSVRAEVEQEQKQEQKPDNDKNKSPAVSQSTPAVVRPLSKVLNLPNKGKIWVTEDPSVITPNLSVSAPSSVGFVDSKISEPVVFSVYTNYAPFIQKAEILVYAPEDIDRTKPAAVVPVKWDPKLTTANVEWTGEWNQSN